MVGLAKMTTAFLGKEMCKYNTRSNWGQAELRKSQVHYAAMDAFAVLKIWDAYLALEQKGKLTEWYEQNKLINAQEYEKLCKDRAVARAERQKLKDAEAKEALQKENSQKQGKILSVIDSIDVGEPSPSPSIPAKDPHSPVLTKQNSTTTKAKNLNYKFPPPEVTEESEWVSDYEISKKPSELVVPSNQVSKQEIEIPTQPKVTFGDVKLARLQYLTKITNGTIKAITYKGADSHQKYDVHVMSMLALSKLENTEESYQYIINELNGMKGSISISTKEWIQKTI